MDNGHHSGIENLDPGDLTACSVHLHLGDIKSHRILPFMSDQVFLDTGNEINQDQQDCQISSDQVVPAISEQVVTESPSELPVFPAGGPPSAAGINDPEIPTIICAQDPPSLCPKTVLETAPRDEDGGEADTDDPLDRVQMMHTKLDSVHAIDRARMTNEEETREECDYSCEDIPSSLPPSSSPPQLFSSSPCASSQSSVGGAESLKMEPFSEAEDPTSIHDCSQDESHLESMHLYDRDNVGIALTDKYRSEMGPASCADDSPGHSKKRMVYQDDTDESHEIQSIKRPRLDSQHYFPPTPMRATLACQSRQFKKLAGPFRPPSKLPVAKDELIQRMINRPIESATRFTPELDHKKPELVEPATHALPLQHKPSKTSRPIAQFKSPLVNKVLPADSCAIRLTPAVQTLERKLQLLKRAVKVKENNEEEVLVKLAEKWIEAGREVAYNVWDATKDACGFEPKTTHANRSYGWEGTSDGNAPWGWDAKPGVASGESDDVDPSLASCGGRQLVPEEDDDVGFNNTLGTLLRRLGIAPEIFGWDDDKEGFSD